MASENNLERFLKIFVAIVCLPFLPLWFCFIYIQKLLESPGNEYPETEQSTSEEENVFEQNGRDCNYARPLKKPQEYRVDKSAYPMPTEYQARKPSSSLYPNSSESSDGEEGNSQDKSERGEELFPHREKHRGKGRKRDSKRGRHPRATENPHCSCQRGTLPQDAEDVSSPAHRGSQRRETAPCPRQRGTQPQEIESIPYPNQRGLQPSQMESVDMFSQRAPAGQMRKTPKSSFDKMYNAGKQPKKKSLESLYDHARLKGEDFISPEDEDVSGPNIEAGDKTLERTAKSAPEHKDQKDFANGQKYKLKEIKDDIFNLKSMKMDLTEFEALDAYACKVPPKSSLAELMQELLQYASTDLEKIRTIWMWICCHIEYDVKGYHNKDHLRSEAEDVLKTGRAVCAGYSGLFCEMCSFAAIECTEISGYSKGYNYDVGKKFKGESDHAWNAVFLNGKWHLLDSTWGAGHVNETCTKFTRKYVEFYFFTHPSLFINNHYPMEERWQLITPRISLSIFENMVFRTGDFFDMGLKYIHPDVQVISTVNGRVIINVEGHSPTLFMYNLNDRKDCATIALTRYGMKLEVLPQKSGDHKLKIYAKLWDSKEEMYSFVCAYLVKCESVDENFKLPKAFHNPLGPSWLTETKGLFQPSHPEPLIYCDDGKCTMKFMVNRELSFASKLSCDEVTLSEEAMRNHVFKTQFGNWVEFKIQLPQSGLYTFAIFTKDKASHSPTHDHVCEYLISCSNRNVHWPGFPKIYSSWTDGCELIEPLSGILPPHQMVTFKLKIPHVRMVQVYGKGACPLTLTKDGYWEGTCNTEDNKHLNVGVSDKMFDTRFSFALQYEVRGT